MNQPLAETEPTAERNQAPVWLVVLLAVISYWAMLFMDNYAGGFNSQVYEPFRSYKQVADANPRDDAQQLVAMGQARYEIYCAGCHQLTGQGSPGLVPPLAGSDWVNAPNPARIIRIVLQGPTGTFKVNDQMWNTPTAMTPFGTSLKDDEIAAILSYVRQAWGNKAGIVKPEPVKAIREETSNHSNPWTMEELLKVSDTQ